MTVRIHRVAVIGNSDKPFAEAYKELKERYMQQYEAERRSRGFDLGTPTDNDPPA